MSKTTVLVIEDEAIIAMDLAGKLGFLGYEVVGTARCGEEAIEMACRLRPRVLLMDIRLKGEMDGIEAAEAIHRQIDVPVIYLTAHTDAATLERIKPTGSYGFILKPFEERDISATIEMALYKHRADKKLRESEERYRNVVENTTAIILRVSPDGVIIFANGQALRFFGYTADELIGKHAVKTIVPEKETGGRDLVSLISEIIADPDRFHTNANENICKDGRRVWIEWTNSGIYDAAGRLKEFLAVGIDATERKRAEEALRQRTGELLTLLDTTPIPIFIAHDPECRKITGNPAAQQLVGLPADANVSKSAPVRERPTQWREMRDGAVLKPEDLPLQRAARGEEIRDYEMDLVFEDGTVKSVVGNATPIRDEHGKPHGGVAILMDITERKRAEESLRKAYAEMEERVKERTRELREKDRILIMQSRQAAMGEMMGNIAHQWRQPLNTVGMIMQTLTLMHDAGELNRENLVAMENQVMELVYNMSGTIDDFSSFFRPDKEKTEFRVRQAVERSVALVEASFKDQNITTEINIKEDPVINGFPNEYSQALLNILHNARDAFETRKAGDPKVTIKVREDKGKSVVTIADNAGGIAGSIIYKVFDPYFTTKGPEHGTGVGLFMAKAIIEKNMGGRVTVRNIADGAEFRIEV